MPQSTLKAWLTQPTSMPAPAKVDAGPVNSNKKDALSSPQDGQPKDTTSSEPRIGHDAVTSSGTASNGSTLPANVEIRACSKEDIPALKRLTGLLLPIQYPDSFYKDIIDDPVTNSITLLAFWHNTTTPTLIDQERPILIGAIRCRLLAYPPSTTPTTALKNEGPTLYLSTLVLLSPYRSHGIATHMLNVLTKRAAYDYGISSVGAHVWEANLDGLEWYRKRGFREVGREEGYYRRLKPGTTVVVQREVGVLDLVGG